MHIMNSGLFFLSGLYCIFGLVGILATIFWIWMLVDCLKNEPSEGNDKILWVLVIILTHGVGAIIYFFIRRQPRIQSSRP
ncbi:hypothetical protein KDW_24380 [Dictyobacter vulcani]|uniref:Cardiolipin synthase N-terminal domain-containing protein n=1 Tax=Dictyobacter vulcani TaxID=2607529 RepID=A0A5J4KSU2_9CHLR|nr:PLD nuclease N-terminal domain-containing protein [Dictyobacter vulcani]GER88276.1 hypothetical protein KDW_24380 [Dictyobacter vulcani]